MIGFSSVSHSTAGVLNFSDNVVEIRIIILTMVKFGHLWYNYDMSRGLIDGRYYQQLKQIIDSIDYGNYSLGVDA